ncbi:MAG: DUF6714 family protein [Luteolibacter sp.]
MTPITQREIDEMKRNHADPEEIQEAETRLQLLKRAEPVIDQIRKAFAGVKLGNGIGMREANGIDDRENEETLAKLRESDEKENWEAFPSDQLQSHFWSPPYFDAEGMRFHLPAYLISELRGYYGDTFHFPVFGMSDFMSSKFTSLDHSQRQAVRAYLIHILDDPDYEFDRSEIEKALEKYWTDDSPEAGAQPR